MPYSAAEFESLYKSCFPTAMHMAMSLLRNQDEARDVVHEVMAKLWESALTPDRPAAFIVRATRNAALNRLNALDTRQRVCRQLSLFTPSGECNVESDQRADQVKKAIDSLLSPREKEVVEKIYAQELSYKDAAKELSVSVATINKNIVSALKKLRNYFKLHND